MKTKIFSYKNFIGAETDLDKGVFLNDPRGNGQLGCVVALEEIEITKEAKDLLRKATREGGSFAPIMIDEGSIGLLGHWKHLFNLDAPVLSRDCDLSVLDKLADSEIAIPQEFKAAADNYE